MENFNFNQPFVVVGAILEKEGKYLLVKESGGPEKGKWNLPAGIWDKGETLVEGAAREVKEETGFEFTPQMLLGTYIRERNNNSVLIFIYRGIFEEIGSNISEDVEETRWFSKEEVSAMNTDTLRFTGLLGLIDEYEKGIGYPLEINRKLGTK